MTSTGFDVQTCCSTLCVDTSAFSTCESMALRLGFLDCMTHTHTHTREDEVRYRVANRDVPEN